MLKFPYRHASFFFSILFLLYFGNDCHIIDISSPNVSSGRSQFLGKICVGIQRPVMVVNFIKNFFEQGYKLLAMRYRICDRCVGCFNFFPISFLFVEITVFFIDGGPKIIKVVSILWMRFLILSENNKLYKKIKKKIAFIGACFFIQYKNTNAAAK